MPDASARKTAFVLGTAVDIVHQGEAAGRVITAARRRQPFAVAALASHGIMEAIADPLLRARLNSFDLVCPDGFSVMVALNFLHQAGLPEPVTGPDLTERLLAEAARTGLPVYFYGSTEATLSLLRKSTTDRHPGLQIAGTSPSAFRPVDAQDLAPIASHIRDSGARIVFLGLGCPRQEHFAYALRSYLDVPVVAVGAAFEFSAGIRSRPPRWVRSLGLEWLWRLAFEPRRLFHRYVVLGPNFIALVLRQRWRRWQPTPEPEATMPERLGA